MRLKRTHSLQYYHKYGQQWRSSALEQPSYHIHIPYEDDESDDPPEMRRCRNHMQHLPEQNLPRYSQENSAYFIAKKRYYRTDDKVRRIANIWHRYPSA
jgi:hypothetical protein